MKLPLLSPEEIRRQAFLFDEVDIGRELLSIAEDREANRHNGTTLERRQELYDEVCLRLAEGISLRSVAKRYGVGRNTLAAIRDRLVASGKMEPYKKRISAKFAILIEDGVDLLQERMDKGDVPTNVIPVVVGVAADKKALIDGEPTSIVDVRAKVELTQAGWDEWLASIKPANAMDRTVQAIEAPEMPGDRAIDAQSTGGTPNA